MRFISLVVAALTLSVPLTAQAQSRSPAELAQLRDSIRAVGGRVIVLLKSTRPGSQLRVRGAPPLSDTELQTIESRLATRRGMRVRGHASMVGAVFGDVDDARLAELSADSNVASIEADQFVVLQATRDGAVTKADASRAQTVPWGVTRVLAPDAWALGFTGAGVKVGMMDSGGDPTHPDLVWAGGYNPNTGGTSPSDWTDDIASCNGHGTHVAGTVAAKNNGVGVVGVAPDVSLYALKVFVDIGGTCGAWVSAQISALQWAVTKGIRVVSASLGGSGGGSYLAALQAAANAGTFFVAAAGNDNGGAVEFPAAFSVSIAVSSLNSSNARSGFSSAGPEVMVGAPGESIESTMPGGAYGTKSGTSMATPHVAGVVALLVQQNPGITLAQVKQELQNGALDIDAAGFDNNTGWGLVRASSSLQGGSAPPLTVAVAPTSRNVSVQQGSSAPSDNATVTMSGTNASSTAWTATKKKSWTTLTSASGTGSGTVAWTRSATGLAAGTWVDTITVTASGAAGSPSVIYDTLRIAAVAPVVLAVSPRSRNIAVQQGSAAPGDNATVTLTGTNAGSTPWTASKKKAWTTLTTASGTGSGAVAWTRDASSLAVGTWVDTITVSATGATGSPTVIYDTVRVTAAPPVVLAVAPVSRNVSVQQGNSAPGDNATVTITGVNAGSATWSVTKRKAWTTLTTASGTGSGTAAWTRNSTGLAVGTYVDTLTVTSVGATGSPGLIYDTLRITAAPIPVALAVSPAGRAVSVQQGNSAPGDNAAVTMTGTNAATTVWSATKTKAWLTLTTASGTGSGTVAWTRSSTGLAVGTYVDTITVTAPGAATGSPSTIYDTLRITAIPVPVTLAVSPRGRAVSVQQGNAAPSDNATVTLAGTNAASTAWIATNKQSWNTLTTASGTGSGTVRWSRDASSLAVGTWVDTITVTAPAATGSPIMVFDTIRVTAPVVPITLVVAPASHNVAVQQGSSAPGDNATVALTGTGASTTTWTATKKKSWTTLTTSSGTGAGVVAWNRSASGLAVGTYVDTITVTAPGAASGSPAKIIDTMRVTAAPVPIVLAVSPASRSTTAQQGQSAAGDNATVSLSGTGANTTAWTATKRKAWITLASASGTGNGTVSWTRSTSGLAVGTYVDTIAVTAPGAASGSPGLIIDTLKITAAPVPIVLAVNPPSRSVTVQQGSAAPGSTATVTLTGTNASAASWIALETSAWTTLVTGNGTGSGTLAWTRSASGLGAGTYVDTITVTAPGAATGSPARIIDTMIVTSAPVSIALSVSPPHRKLSTEAGTSAAGDNAAVILTGTNAGATAWSATSRQPWTTLVTSSGTGGGTVAWARSTSGLGAGIYVDTITVTAPGAVTGSPAMVIDTLQITAAPVVTLALNVSPASRNIAVARGTVAPADFAYVSLTGTNASTTTWTATNRASWNLLGARTARGNGALSWTRNVSTLPIGTYIDTITVTAPGVTSGAGLVIDTIRIVPRNIVLAVHPGSRRSRVFAVGRSTGVLDLAVDSAIVDLDGSDSTNDTWIATTTASRLQLVTGDGLIGTPLRWQRLAVTLPVGLYVDTLHLQLQRDPSVQASFVDSLEIVSVALPDPAVAVADLFFANKLTADQRMVLDKQGNNNGRFDIGDFLAWVDHDHLRLSASVIARLKDLPPEGSTRIVKPQ